MDPSPNPSDKPPDVIESPMVDCFVTPKETLDPNFVQPPSKLGRLTPKQLRVLTHKQSKPIDVANQAQKRKVSNRKSSKVPGSKIPSPNLSKKLLSPELGRRKKKGRPRSPGSGKSTTSGSLVKDVIGFFEAHGSQSVPPSLIEENTASIPLIDLPISSVTEAVKMFKESVEVNLDKVVPDLSTHIPESVPEVVHTLDVHMDGAGSSETRFVFGQSRSSNFAPEFRFDDNGCLKGSFGTGTFDETVMNPGNSNDKVNGILTTTRVSFSEMLKKSNESEDTKLEFIPPVQSPDGVKVAQFSVEEIKKAGLVFSFQLFGYFIGTSMDYQVVNSNLRRMWRGMTLKRLPKGWFGRSTGEYWHNLLPRLMTYPEMEQ